MLGGAEAFDHCLHSCVPWLCLQPILELQGCFDFVTSSFSFSFVTSSFSRVKSSFSLVTSIQVEFTLQVRLYLVDMCPGGTMAMFGR